MIKSAKGQFHATLLTYLVIVGNKVRHVKYPYDIPYRLNRKHLFIIRLFKYIRLRENNGTSMSNLLT